MSALGAAVTAGHAASTSAAVELAARGWLAGLGVEVGPPLVVERLTGWRPWAVLSCGHALLYRPPPELGEAVPCPFCACPGCRPRRRERLDLRAPFERWEACPDCGTRYPPFRPPPALSSADARRIASLPRPRRRAAPAPAPAPAPEGAVAKRSGEPGQ